MWLTTDELTLANLFLLDFPRLPGDMSLISVKSRAVSPPDLELGE
jgi:hypothetical protein